MHNENKTPYDYEMERDMEDHAQNLSKKERLIHGVIRYETHKIFTNSFDELITNLDKLQSLGKENLQKLDSAISRLLITMPKQFLRVFKEEDYSEPTEIDTEKREPLLADYMRDLKILQKHVRALL